MRRDAGIDLLLAAAFVGGVRLGFELGFLPVSLLATLAALGLALGRRAGGAATGLALGLLFTRLADPAAGGGLERGREARPVEIVGTIDAHPRATSFGCSTFLEPRWMRRGDAFEQAPTRVLLLMPAAACLEVRLGEAWRARGFLRPPSRYRNRRTVQTGPWRLAVKSTAFLEREAPAGPVSRLSARWRRRVEAAFSDQRQRAGDSAGLALARALVLGDASSLAQDQRRGLRRLGLSHLIAVSGLHLVLISTAVSFLAGALPLPLRWTLSALALAMFTLVVGPQPAVLRALVMAGVAHLALLLERPPSSRRGLALAAAGLVAWQPAIVNDLGFALTLAATAGLVVLQPGLAERWRSPLGVLARPLSATVAAELAVLPLTLPRFYLLTPLAPLANLLAVPWCGLMLGASLGWVLLALVAPGVAAAAAPVLDALALPGLALADWRGSIAYLIPLRIAWPAAAALAALLGWTLSGRGRRARPLALLAALALVAAHHPAARRPPAVPELVALDVGQGDATLVRSGRRAMLIDGGGWSSGDFGGTVLLPALLDEGVAGLDAVVISHDDADHCRGLLEIADYLPVREVWTASGRGGACTEAVIRKVTASRTARAHRRLASGDELRWGDWRVGVLWPEAADDGADNELSLVLRLEANGHRALFTGDAGERVERELRRRAVALESAVLKVGHHGSRGASSSGFLAAVRPRWALISAGAGNRYCHPSDEVLARLDLAGARVLRTDLSGALRLSFPADRGPVWRGR